MVAVSNPEGPDSSLQFWEGAALEKKSHNPGKRRREEMEDPQTGREPGFGWR